MHIIIIYPITEHNYYHNEKKVRMSNREVIRTSLLAPIFMGAPTANPALGAYTPQETNLTKFLIDDKVEMWPHCCSSIFAKVSRKLCFSILLKETKIKFSVSKKFLI